MKAKELKSALQEADIDDIVNVKFNSNYTGSIRKYGIRNNIIIFSADIYDNDLTCEFDGVETLKELSKEESDCEMVYRVPSMGFYKVQLAKRAKFCDPDYTDDYWYSIVLLCDREPFCDGDLASFDEYCSSKIDIDEYDDDEDF